MKDSANAFACSHEFNSRSVGRTTRLGMAYLRDILHVLCLPYVSAPFNLADLGTKFPSDRRIMDSANALNRIAIRFLSRKELKTVVYFVRNNVSVCRDPRFLVSLELSLFGGRRPGRV